MERRRRCRSVWPSSRNQHFVSTRICLAATADKAKGARTLLVASSLASLDVTSCSPSIEASIQILPGGTQHVAAATSGLPSRAGTSTQSCSLVPSVNRPPISSAELFLFISISPSSVPLNSRTRIWYPCFFVLETPPDSLFLALTLGIRQLWSPGGKGVASSVLHLTSAKPWSGIASVLTLILEP